MTKDYARSVYEILVREAGAYPNDTTDFIYAQSGPDEPEEWRFQGLLKLGGKFLVKPRLEMGGPLLVSPGGCPWSITSYKEDRSGKADKVISTVNAELARLHQQFLTNKPVVNIPVVSTSNHVDQPDYTPAVSLRQARSQPKMRKVW